jgi:sugar/nucleoside kinase (ribokinase family)
MSINPDIEPIDYLLIGHLTQDITTSGIKLGGTAAYGALTARALGLKVGIVTSTSRDIDLTLLNGITIHNIPAERSTTFENITTSSGRVQHVYHTACSLTADMVPEQWTQTSILHIGPVAQEVSVDIIDRFPDSYVGITPQGWMREWDTEGRISQTPWINANKVLARASAAVISIEDVQGDESIIAELFEQIPILVVTEADLGARLYWNGDYRHFSPPAETQIDATGAGDIFATAFFIRMQESHDPWESARFATQIASRSITRYGLDGVPTAEEIAASRVTIYESK